MSKKHKTKKRKKNDWEKIADKADFVKDVWRLDDLYRQPAIALHPSPTQHTETAK